MRRFVVLNDGIGLDLASRYLYGETFPDNLNGTDFTPALLAAAGAEARVFLFGARPEVVGEGRRGVRGAPRLSSSPASRTAMAGRPIRTH